MRYLTIPEVLRLHLLIAQQSGGGIGIRDLGALESALAQPQMAFGGQELYPALVEKAAALCFFIVRRHPFIDGNKRAGHAAMDTFLDLNGYDLDAETDDQEKVILGVASGESDLRHLTEWLQTKVRPKDPQS